MLVHDFMGTDPDDVEEIARIQKSFFFIERKSADPGVRPEQVASFLAQKTDSLLQDPPPVT